MLDLGRHREIAGNAVTPSSRHAENEAVFNAALTTGGVFCALAHYWELRTPSHHSGEPCVEEQLRLLVDRALQDSRVVWRPLGAIATQG